MTFGKYPFEDATDRLHRIGAEAAKEIAIREIEAEDFDDLVEKKKDYIKMCRAMPWWQRLFPYKITIERID